MLEEGNFNQNYVFSPYVTELLYYIGIAFSNSKEICKCHCTLRTKSIKGSRVLKVILNVPMEKKPLNLIVLTFKNTISFIPLSHIYHCLIPVTSYNQTSQFNQASLHTTGVRNWFQGHILS